MFVYSSVNDETCDRARCVFSHREVNSGFFYKSAGERDKLVKAERKFIEDRVMKIIELKNKVCADTKKGFVVINQKVIDTYSFLNIFSI